MSFVVKGYDNFLVFITEIKKLCLDFFSFLFVKIYFSFLLLLNLSLWCFAYFMYKGLDHNIVVLSYNVDLGINLIGPKSYFFFIPLLSLALILINKVILLFLLKKDDFKFLAYFLLSFLILFNIFSFLALFSVYLVNF